MIKTVARWTGLCAIAVLLLPGARAGMEMQLGEEGPTLTVGGDLRLRLTKIDSYVLPGPGGAIGALDDLEYLRLRTRVWAGLEFNESLSLNARLVNRSQHYSTRHKDPRNDYDGEPSETWAFWDETVLDSFYVDVKAPLGLDPWSFRLGRQDIILGNGMVFLEGTPYDQGRSIYFDGLRADYRCGDHTLTLLALHNHKKDNRGTFIADEERPLRRGETGILGAYFTKALREGMNADVYAFHIDIDDDAPGSAQPNHSNDQNAIMQLVGGRLFGAATDTMDYSVELAREFGTFHGNGFEQDMKGMMLDARLTLKQWAEKPMAPVLGLEYTYMSGDDNDGDDDFEGWHPALAEYPIWREELMPLKVFGNWTNLHQARAALNLALNARTSLQVAGATMYSDQDDPAIVNGVTADGNHIGETLSAFLDYAVNPNMKVSLQASQLYPGDHLPDTETTEWLRFQTIYSF